MLKVGDRLPEFEGHGSEGCPIHTATLLGKPVVIFFFPKAFTPNCVRETKAFRDEFPELARSGVQIVGVSTDPIDEQCRFAEWAGVPFPLVADTDCKVSKAFGVLWPIVGVAKRVTFVADGAGIVRNVFHHELRALRHIADVKRAIQEFAV